MKTHINTDTLEFFALVAGSSPQGLIVAYSRTQYKILLNLGLITSLDRDDVTRLTTKGEIVVSQILKDLSGESSWQPIATAPKDGTMILLRNRGSSHQEAITGRWDSKYNYWREIASAASLNPTQWMPPTK